MSDQTPAPQGETASLELTDIQNVVHLLDHACNEGAFKGWANIEKVLLQRQRLTAFLAAAAAANPADTPAPEAASDTPAA